MLSRFTITANLAKGGMGKVYRRAGVFLVVAGLALPASLIRAEDIGEDPRVADAINLLHRWIDAQRDYDQFPGISIALVYRQQVLWEAGLGYADLDARRPATSETMYSICSISKLFTSISAMQLRDRGDFRLDDSLSSVLPWFELENNEAEERLVSVRSLLTHTAGFGESTWERPDTAPYLYYPSREKFLSLIPTEKLVYRPWEHYNYSNIGMALLGEVVAEVSKQSYAEYVEQHILEPLGMSSTTPDIGEVVGSKMLATGYGPIGRGGGRAAVGDFEGRGMIPALGFASTVQDLAKFASWQFRLLDTGSSEILDANTLREMQRVQYVDPSTDAATGLGFAVYRDKGKTVVGHSGDCPGYRSDLYISPEDQIAVIALANAMIPVWDFTSRAFEIIAPTLAAVAQDPGGGKVLPEELYRYVGSYDGFPWSGEFQVLPWNGSLAVVRFPTDNPMDVILRLEYLGNHKFREIRDDSLRSMEYSFEMDSTGRVARMVTDKYPRARLR
jgi:CubicO group peptidase (beta-lactamase class C family)